MVILIDIDGTICSEESPFHRPLARPFPRAVEQVNSYKTDGHVVVFWTGRDGISIELEKTGSTATGFATISLSWEGRLGI